MATSTPSTVDAGVAFGKMKAAFQRALERQPKQLSESQCVFAGETAEIRIVGHGLRDQILRPFSHLCTSDERSASPRLHIDLWDEQETQTACPFEPLAIDDQVRHTNRYTEYGLIIGAADDRYLGCQRPRCITWFDCDGQHLIGSIASADRLPLYDRGKPLHYPLLRWHNQRGLQVIHAGLVVNREQGVLLVGKGTTGKSTVALSCLEAGFQFLGDDYIALEPADDGSTRGYSLYSSAWIMAAHAARFPTFAPHLVAADQPGAEKSLLPLSEIVPQQLRRAAQIDVVVMPRLVEGGTTRTRPATKGEALLAVAPSSLLQLPSSGAESLGRLADLVDRLPCYWLEYDGDWAAIPACLREMLENIPRR